MNTRGHKFGGPWTEQKLECVSAYLQEYTKIMNNYNFHFAYIDAFAGIGHRELKREDDIAIQRFLSGSARRALEVNHPLRNTFLLKRIKPVLRSYGNSPMNFQIIILNASMGMLTDI